MERKRIPVIVLWLAAGIAGTAGCVFWYCRFGCPILYFTGAACPGCGMTRALLAALRLDFSAAFSFHPLFFLPPLAIPAVLLRKKLAPRLWVILLSGVLAAFLLTYLIRLFSGDPIVSIHPENGVLFRALGLFQG